tara:strand:+ start:306 stop:584 length:279 start_codon:yes stop_codon:yes gene_type:complete
MQAVLNKTFTATLAGDSIWDYAGPSTVTVTDISVYTDEDDYKSIYVEHNGGEDSWRMYTDSGFEQAISEQLGYAVMFTEQGMQEDGIASMEA